MSRRWGWLAALVCSLWGSLGYAQLALPDIKQDAQPPLLRDYSIDHWTTAEGLPHNAIRAMTQTPDQHLWLATWEGLVKYNGLDFKVFDRRNSPALPDAAIADVYVDTQGRLWLSDARGDVARQAPDGQWHIWPAPNSSGSVWAPSMAMDAQQRLWLLYAGHGLSYIDTDGRLHDASSLASIPPASFYGHLSIDQQRRIWFGTTQGLFYRDPNGQIHPVAGAPELLHGLVWPYLAPDGQLWAVSGNKLYSIDVTGHASLTYAVPGIGLITALLQDRHHVLWLGTEHDGVRRIYGHKLEAVQHRAALSAGRIINLTEDREGSIWVGTNGGLYRLRQTLFSNYTVRDGLSHNYVHALLEDAQARLWVGSLGGLDVSTDQGRLHPVHLPTASGTPPEVYSLASDAQSRLWVGTYHDGIYILKSGQVRQHIGQAQGLAVGSVRAIQVGSDGRVWLGTQHGLVSIHHGRVSRPARRDLPDGLITALAEVDGSLWIGTLHGVWCWHGDKLRHIELTAGNGRVVMGIQATPDGAIWISSDRGLYRYWQGQLGHVGLDQGMPVDTVFQWARDAHDNVWINTNRGLLRTSLSALNAAIDRHQPIHPELYDEMNGMASAQGNGGSAPDIVLRRDGSIMAATAGGIAVMDPDKLAAYRQLPAPPVVFEKLSINGLAVPATAAQRIQIPRYKQLTIEYVGLSYLMSQRIEYRTRLDGVDTDWVERGHQRTIEYIGLAPGDYVLHVSAAHPGGAWSQPEAVLRFTVMPLWWERSDLRLAGVVGLILLALLFYRLMVAQYKRSNARLAATVAQRTQDLQQQTDQLLAANQEKTQLLNQLRIQAESFERQAREDVLTGLPNRRAFDDILARDVERGRRHQHPLCLIMLDVDYFKRVNDQHSHQVGDAVLREVGRLLRDTCRISDVAARLGGEEFAVILANTRLDDARRVLQRIRAHFKQQQDWLGIEGLVITFSAGLAQMDPAQANPEALLMRADEALYRAKHSGRDRYCEG